MYYTWLATAPGSLANALQNCHTGMMETDAYCPSCHATAEIALAAPPEQGGSTPNGLWMLLPVFGGALGGLAYCAVVAAHGNGASRSGSLAGSWTAIKWVVGIVLILLG